MNDRVQQPLADINEAEPHIPWTQKARMRDHLAHRYASPYCGSVNKFPQVRRHLWARLGSNQRHLACKQNCHKRCADLRKWRSPTSEIETVVISLVSTRTCSRVTEYTKLTSDA